MKDRFTKGFLAGLISGIPTLIFSLIAKELNLTTLRWANFAAILIYGRKSMNLMEEIFSILAVFAICGVLGIIFSLVIPKISSVNYLLKSWIFSITFWFSVFTITMLFKVPGLQIIPGKTAIMNFIQATLWGLSLGYCLKWFDTHTKV